MSFLLLSLAFLLFPPSAAHRLRWTPRRKPTLPKPNQGTVVLGSALFGLLAGAGGAIAAAVVARTLWHDHHERATHRERLKATTALAAGLAGFVAELKAGAHPAPAASGAAEDAEPPASEVLRTIATTAARGGDVATALRDFPEAHQLARAWRLSAEHGVPLADVLAEVRRDLDRRVAFAGQVAARLAGPRASAAVLAGMPVFGVLLGEAVGAGPTEVLRTTVVGQVLLVLGAVLVCAGLRWSARLTRQVVA
ncbi:type II secretion system F family protein [Saccharothrix violaceirubra]|uniref:Tight adherence protein B n=1 Tax=Saccharothrix violaceirubra TaxID=413306 RepID=A0A7W7T988_9PSEU|nr:type II secretion system F family protein [Saccharothrix violaceirubra]MBB4968923.1 tight adherence protein B [Saccharothrix violaceirubra]